jgi:4-oxalocrotonate tautomerase
LAPPREGATRAPVIEKREAVMPIIDVKLFEGRTIDQKRLLVKAMTEAVVKSLDVKPDDVRITLNEMSRDNHAIAGLLVVDRNK